MRIAAVLLLTAAGTGSALAQTYTFEMRLIPDGMAGSPGGPSVAHTYPGGVLLGPGGPTRIGFWLQARVSQTGNQNWGVVRASSPSGTVASQIVVSDPANGSGFQRGAVDAAATFFGRPTAYRHGGPSSGPTGNPPSSAPFPGHAGNENGALDNGGGGGGGSMMTRIYGFDCYMGSSRVDTDVDDVDDDGDVDDNGDGLPENPWGVNGSSHPANVDGVPIPSDGSFSPWANLYRFYFDMTDLFTPRDAVISASALLNGAQQAFPIVPGSDTYALAVGPGQTLNASYTLRINNWPTPGAAGLLGLGILAAARRRR